jgi:hypothetical protein
MAAARDLKSRDRKVVRVRVPPPLPPSFEGVRAPSQDREISVRKLAQPILMDEVLN